MKNRTANIIAIILLSAVFVISLIGANADSATMDELAHLPAGYSYLIRQDMRLNPEHPPLIKDLAVIPLLFIKNINFPSDIQAWKIDTNGQWDFGRTFLYESGNNADEIIFWGRFPMVLVLLLLGFLIFLWAKNLFGNKGAILALFLFSFSPSFLAHGRLVTTDIGSALGITAATYFFIRFLRTPSFKNIIFAGILLGLAEIAKFTTILLIPFFFILIFIWSAVNAQNFNVFLKKFFGFILRFVGVLVVALLLIGAIYQYHTWHYPKDRQAQDTKTLLNSHPLKQTGPVLSWMAEKPVLRSYSYYLTGLALVFQRASFGNTGYFLGEVSNLGWKNYFPIVYLIKEPLPFHILSLFAVIYALWTAARHFKSAGATKLKAWISAHFAEFAMILFIGIYWSVSLKSSLNIGIRHLLPVFPFTIILLSGMISYWLEKKNGIIFFRPKIKYALVGALMAWQIFSVAKTYPGLLSYCNELAEGTANCYRSVVDSNYDWGQDLKRLRDWADEKDRSCALSETTGTCGIKKLYLDYFGGGSPEYYLKDKYVRWDSSSSSNDFPRGNYFAVSATSLQRGKGMPNPEFKGTAGFYSWLNAYKPVARAGYSIFIYYIP